MEKDYLVLKRASASRPSGEWKDDDYDVLAEGVIVGRIMKAAASPVETPWLFAKGNRGHPCPSSCGIDGYSTGSRSSGTARELLSAPCRQSSRCGTQGN
jgi:hypothetical protein